MSRDYQYACERAELFGQPIPSEEEWIESEKTCKQDVEEVEDQEDALAQDLDQADESGKRIAGGLDELNSILSSTQRKINRFKTVCGSLGTILKIRRGSRPSTPKSTPKHEMKEETTNEQCPDDDASPSEEKIEVDESGIVEREAATSLPNKKIDIDQKMGSHLDKLDSLITKAENAQFSMSHQTKQIRRILK